MISRNNLGENRCICCGREEDILETISHFTAKLVVRKWMMMEFKEGEGLAVSKWRRGEQAWSRKKRFSENPSWSHWDLQTPYKIEKSTAKNKCLSLNRKDGPEDIALSKNYLHNGGSGREFCSFSYTHMIYVSSFHIHDDLCKDFRLINSRHLIRAQRMLILYLWIHPQFVPGCLLFWNCR